jgi:hypothetical protein
MWSLMVQWLRRSPLGRKLERSLIGDGLPSFFVTHFFFAFPELRCVVAIWKVGVSGELPPQLAALTLPSLAPFYVIDNLFMVYP